MNIHKNAKTTAKMRALFVKRRQVGETPRHSQRGRRFARACFEVAEDRTSRPPRPRTRITSEPTFKIETLRRARPPFGKIAREAGLSLGPRIATAKGLSRLAALDQRIEIGISPSGRR